MKTLKQLIAEGLQVGALVDTKYTNPLQILYIDEYYCRIYNTGAKIEVSVQLSNSTEYELTTAYDSDIDPKTLPIPEPFWTGWLVHRLGINERYKFEELSENQVRIFTGGWPKEYLKSDCRPCLSPK